MRTIIVQGITTFVLGAALLSSPLAVAARSGAFVTKESTRAVLRKARAEAPKVTLENNAAATAAQSVIRSSQQSDNVDPATLKAAIALSRRAGPPTDQPPPPATRSVGETAEQPAPAAPDHEGAVVATAAGDSAGLKVGEARVLTLPEATETEFRDFIGRQLKVDNAGAVAVLPGAVETLAADESAVILKALAFNSQPLKLNPQTGQYEGRVSVGVVNLEGGGGALASPITFQLLGPVTSDPDASIVTGMAPPYQHIAIASDRARTEPIEVSVVSNIDPSGQPLELSFAPSLIVSASPTRIQGWGLDTADIKIHTVGPYDGRERPIEVDADTGVLVSADPSLSTNGIAGAVIRSSSTGRSVITASANGFPNAIAEIEFLFPAAFIVAALLGGLIGGTIAVATTGRTKGRKAAKRIGVGILCGVVVFGLYALGVNLTQFTLPARAGEVLVFVVSAIGALAGSKILKAPVAA